MLQNLYTNYQINPCYKQANLSFINPYNKEISVPRIYPKQQIEKQITPKKKVTFNPKVSVTDVESWKKYNKDMSKETEFMKLKEEIITLKALKNLRKQRKLEKKYNQEFDECVCNIF